MENFDKFLKKMKLLSLSVCENNTPYAFSAFYAYDEKSKFFAIASDSKTRHIQISIKNPKVSGTVALDTRIIGKIKGVQFNGILSPADETAKKIYFKKFPFALAMKPEIFKIHIVWLKFTDNSIGFGRKFLWQR
ncbi:hypothetical protein [Campylobacter hominis]|uniref:hypothetical protein n=1 Tax=Campylobacter hominis TaxID=76517 RepID=UPI00248D3005|nr:hypothetical protein [Campylobacter hominis]